MPEVILGFHKDHRMRILYLEKSSVYISPILSTFQSASSSNLYLERLSSKEQLLYQQVVQCKNTHMVCSSENLRYFLANLRASTSI